MSEEKSLQKEPYEKPEIRVIELKADEVLAVGCKTIFMSAFGSPQCNGGGCSGLGS